MSAINNSSLICWCEHDGILTQEGMQVCSHIGVSGGYRSGGDWQGCLYSYVDRFEVLRKWAQAIKNGYLAVGIIPASVPVIPSE